MFAALAIENEGVVGPLARVHADAATERVNDACELAIASVRARLEDARPSSIGCGVVPGCVLGCAGAVLAETPAVFAFVEGCSVLGRLDLSY